MFFDSSYGLGVQPELVGVYLPIDVEVYVYIGSLVPLAPGISGRRPVVMTFAIEPVVGHVRRVVSQIRVAI